MVTILFRVKSSMGDESSPWTFVDTNILVYGHDKDAGVKHERAAALVAELWERQRGIISTQVLQEFYVTVTRKIPKPITPGRARAIIRAYGQWKLETNALETILRASEIQHRHRLSFWDALIIVAGMRSGAEILLTEDLNHGQVIEGIRVCNPFA